ncbi:hypothetical protein [Hymenobacter psoromatis]|uniref:hypothetical protein n=1 Tax=Hymenobacter psoromatis TaxID=1484116 RepID=UPI001CBDCA1C|nr:hypothetical protein [Hymenobacter psoromatis]
MNHLTFWQYIHQQGVETPTIVFGLLSLGVLGCSLFLARKLWLDFRQRKPLTYGDVFSPLISLFLSAGFFIMAYFPPHDRYLLREGASRYTTAKVFKYGYQRGNKVFVYEYYVAGQRYQSSHECGPEDWRDFTCPDLGVRLYVRFSPEDPSTDVVTNTLVPDSVRTIPPLGWAKLPRWKPAWVRE